MWHSINYDKTQSLILILYLTGLIAAHTAARYYVVFISLYILVVFQLGAKRDFQISKQHIKYYLSFLLLINLSSFYGGSEVFWSNLLITLSTMVTIKVYEFFARVHIKENHVYAFIWIVMGFSVLYALLSSNFDRLYFVNQNSVPILMLLMVYLCDLYLAEKKLTIFCVWCFALVFTVLSESRAGFFALLSYLVLRNVKSRRLQALFFVAALVAIVVLYVFGYSVYLPFVFLGKPIYYLAKRESLWSLASELVVAYPLGMGYVGYRRVFQDVLDVTRSPHNTYLNILLQFGWLYFVLYLCFVTRLLKDSRLHITSAVIFSAYLRAFFESSTPFGLSLSSALLLLPLYLEVGFLRSGCDKSE